MTRGSLVRRINISPKSPIPNAQRSMENRADYQYHLEDMENKRPIHDQHQQRGEPRTSRLLSDIGRNRDHEGTQWKAQKGSSDPTEIRRKHMRSHSTTDDHFKPTVKKVRQDVGTKRRSDPKPKLTPSFRGLLCRSRTMQNDVIISHAKTMPTINDDFVSSPKQLKHQQQSSDQSRGTCSACSDSVESEDEIYEIEDEEDSISDSYAPVTEELPPAPTPEIVETPETIEAVPRPKKQARFADEIGESIAEIQVIEKVKSQKLMIILLQPAQRKFELLQISCDEGDCVYASDIVARFPALATDDVLRKQHYKGLARRRQDPNTGSLTAENLSNDISIQDYKLVKNEVLVATIEGYTVDELMTMAAKLLHNKRVRKAVHKGKSSRRCVRQVDSTDTPTKRKKTQKKQ